MTIEAMKQALEALEYDNPSGRTATISALRAAIEQAEKPRQWQDLTEEDIWDAIRPLYRDDTSASMAIDVSMDEYRAIEAKLKERNG